MHQQIHKLSEGKINADDELQKMRTKFYFSLQKSFPFQKREIFAIKHFVTSLCSYTKSASAALKHAWKRKTTDIETN